MTTYKTDYIGVNKYTRPGSKRTTTKGIVLHYTASPGGTAANHKSYFGRGADGRFAGAHLFVDKNEALCIVPLNEIAYHANEAKCRISSLYGKVGGYQGNANVTTIGIEMCIEKDGTIATATFNRTVDVTVELLKKYGLKANNLYRHYDITGKNCPAPWVSKPAEWTRFRDAVKAKLNGSSAKVETAKTKSTETFYKTGATLGLYRVIKACSTYSGVDFTTSKKLQALKPGTAFTVTDVIKFGNKYRFKLKNGEYVSAKRAYLEKV